MNTNSYGGREAWKIYLRVGPKSDLSIVVIFVLYNSERQLVSYFVCADTTVSTGKVNYFSPFWHKSNLYRETFTEQIYWGQRQYPIADSRFLTQLQIRS